MNDNDIVQLYIARSEDAVRYTSIQYGSRLKGLAYNILGCKEDAEEIVNDTYLALWNSIPPQKPTYFFAYAAKICRYLSLDRFDRLAAKKRSAVIVELTSELEQCIPDRHQLTASDPANIGRLLNSFIQQQPCKNQEIFVRRYWAGESISTIAEKTGLREGAIKTKLFRIRKKLKQYLEEEGVIP